MTKRIIATLLAAAWFPTAFWLGGVDLTARSFLTALCFMYSCSAAIFVYTLSWKD